MTSPHQSHKSTLTTETLTFGERVVDQLAQRLLSDLNGHLHLFHNPTCKRMKRTPINPWINQSIDQSINQ
jgi:hypothetical protein